MAEQQVNSLSFFSGSGGGFGGGLPACVAVCRVRCQAGRPGHVADVQDQGCPAVSHDGGAGVEVDVSEVASQGLDHNLFGIVHFIDNQSVFLISGHNHGDVQGALRVLAPIGRFPAFRPPVVRPRRVMA